MSVVARVVVGLSVCAGTRVAQGDPPSPQALYDLESPGYEAVANYPNSDIALAATALGQFAVILPADRMVPMCTAFAIAPNLVFTAKHCLHPKLPDGRTLPDAEVVGVTFLMGRIAQQDRQETYALKLTPLAIGASQEAADDYVVFEAVRAFPTKSSIQYPRLGKDPSRIEKLNLLSYPSMMQQLQMSTDHCRTAAPPIEGALIRHECITEGGSSGAPIFDEHFNVIGLHTQGGYDAHDPQSANVGVLMSHIVANNKNVATYFRDPPRNGVPTTVGVENTKLFVDTTLGDKLLLADGGWFIQRGSQKGPAFRLVPQQSSTGRQVLWDSVADRLYEIPKDGGEVRSRVGSTLEWTPVGYTAPTQ